MRRFILAATLVSNSAYSLIAPFLPLEYELKEVPPSMIGWIFATYSLSVIVLSPIISSHILHRFNRQHLINTGLLAMGVCFALFGWSSKIENPSTLTYVALAIRAMQGASSALIQTTCLSIATNDFPSEKEAMIGYIEAASGLGMVVGPIFGSVVYSQLGFAGAFYFCGVVIALFVVASHLFFINTRRVSPSER
jgi:MFS family permease